MSDTKGRMLPPSRPISRTHTPQPSLLSQGSDPLDDVRSRLSFTSTLSSVSSLPDLKKANAKAGAKRPKFVARASQYLIGTYGKVKEPSIWEDLEPKHDQGFAPLEQIVNSLQCEILANPYKALGVERNGSVLRILEGYMTLLNERDVLKKQLGEVVLRHDKNVDMLEDERKGWKQDEEMFRTEIKRLEIMIAEGRTGVSQVMLARQQSMVRPRGLGRPRRSSSKSEAGQSLASTASSKSGPEVKVEARPMTPSKEMRDLSKNMKAHRSFLSLDFFPDRPPSRLRGLSLADVDIPKHWRKKSETSNVPSIATSPAKSLTSDFSSDGGDLLPDELEQQELDKQAIEHVAKRMAMAQGTDIEDNIDLLAGQLNSKSMTRYVVDDPTPRPTRPHAQSLSDRSADDMTTIRRPKANNIAQRRGNEAMHINTNTENERPGMGSASGHSHRPFSFYAGDDKTIMNDLRTAPPKLAGLPSDSSATSDSEEELPLRRHNSLIPGLVPEHVLARPRREDSSSSVITSLQRSPLDDGRGSRPVSAVGIGGSSGGATRPSSSSLTRASSVSILGDRTNDRVPVTPRLSSATRAGSVRSNLTVVKGAQSNVQSLVMELEGKGKDSVAVAAAQTATRKEKKGKKDKEAKADKKEGKKKSPKTGKKDKTKKEN